MQSQPQTYIVSGPPHCQQFYPLQQGPLSPQPSQPQPLFPSFPIPDVVGEGEVTSVVQPDGSVQYYFRPTNRWQWNTNQGTYFVTYVHCPVFEPTKVFQQNQPLQPVPSFGFQNQLALPSPGQYKFHNDQCTSTADIEYFFPRLRSWDVTPKACAAVQFDSPPVKARNPSNSRMSIDSSSCDSMSSYSCCVGCSCRCRGCRAGLPPLPDSSDSSLDDEARRCLEKLKEKREKKLAKERKKAKEKIKREQKQKLEEKRSLEEEKKHKKKIKKIKDKEDHSERCDGASCRHRGLCLPPPPPPSPFSSSFPIPPPPQIPTIACNCASCACILSQSTDTSDSSSLSECGSQPRRNSRNENHLSGTTSLRNCEFPQRLCESRQRFTYED